MAPAIPPQVDFTRPASARVSDCLAGGRNAHGPDRELAARLTDPAQGGYPGLRDMAADSRAFTRAAVYRLASLSGITQFLDLGCGYPASPSPHTEAVLADASSRWVYADSDPVVISRASALHTKTRAATAVRCDLAAPADVLARPAVTGLLSLGRPACVLLASVLHYWPAAQAARIIAGYAGRLAPGSAVLLSVPWFADEALAARLSAMYAPVADVHFHPPDEVQGWLEDAGLRVAHQQVGNVRTWPMLSAPRDCEACVVGGVAMRD